MAHSNPMVILNLGCGTKTANAPAVVNIDWSAYLRIARNPIFRRLAPILLDAERLNRLSELPRNVLVHDLSKGIPFPDASVDAVYHSHLFEHLDRSLAPTFLAEVRRVLLPGGLHRLVMPDLEHLVRKYSASLEACEHDSDALQEHDSFVSEMYEQSVRRDAYSSQFKTPTRRRVERVLLGDARRRGEAHRWMYDWANLSSLLTSAGFSDIQRRTYDQSDIQGWNELGLDRDSLGLEYKPGSLYIEAARPR